jgi:EAL domain-containing protein (putative c-di-GMP-specific phosphodiesterase class I)
MLMVVSQSLAKSQVLIDLARQLSLTVSYYSNVETLERLMGGRSRRFVVLGEEDISNDVVDALVRANRHAQFGLVVCGTVENLRKSDRARAAKTLQAYPIIEWLEPEPEVGLLGAALRKCRRRMLKLGKGEVEKALLNREFFLQYQPKVERTEDTEWRTREVEALIRWRHPEHGLLGPLEFLPEAEAFELIGPISEFVLFESASQIVRWRDKGLDLRVCINLASSQLNNASLPQIYSRIVKKLDLGCANFTFEVTEHDIAASEAPHLLVLNELRELGFRLSLDDFGVAMASLGTFEQLPFDEIKIHASALKRAQENPVALKVLAAVTGLAHNLGISVCAEGVEDRATFEFLKTIQCDKMQGYLISEAVMPDIIRKVYRAESKSPVGIA